MWLKIEFNDNTGLVIKSTKDTGMCSIPVPSRFLDKDGMLVDAVINETNGQLIDLTDDTIANVVELDNAEFLNMEVDKFVSKFF